jgi:ParB-like chromosome segregation protein Spo0J
MSENNSIGLPYQEIKAVSSRDQIRSSFKRGAETFYIKFSKLKVRDGFNVRNDYGDIKGLADSIEALGLNTPLRVDVLANGTVYIEQGHRRFKALQLLQERGTIGSIEKNGLRNGMVECFVNRQEVSELDRLLRQYSSNKQEGYSSLDLADLCLRLEHYFEKTHQQIAENLGISRQSVDNLVKLAKEPDEIRQAIRSGKLPATAAIDLIRKIKDDNKRLEYVLTQTGTKARITVGEVKNIGSKNRKTEVDEHEFDQKDSEVEEDDTETRRGLPASVVDFIQPEPGDGVFDGPKMENITNDEPPQFTPTPAKPKEIENPEHADKEEAHLCERVIANLDKIAVMIANVQPGLRKDLEQRLEWCQKDLEQIHKYVKRKR